MLADAVLAVKKRLVEKITKPIEILVLMDGGVCTLICRPISRSRCIDYDVEGVERERLEISPVDGEACVISNWGA